MGGTFFKNLLTVFLELSWYIFFCLFVCGFVSLDNVNLAENNYTFLIQPPMINFFGSSSRVPIMREGSPYIQNKCVDSSVLNSKEINRKGGT